LAGELHVTGLIDLFLYFFEGSEKGLLIQICVGCRKYNENVLDPVGREQKETGRGLLVALPVTKPYV
jgi:hypothetical protein